VSMNEGYDVSRQPPQLLQASPPFDQSQGGPRERRLAQPLPGMQQVLSEGSGACDWPQGRRTPLPLLA
jgi:hypothetical protein